MVDTPECKACGDSYSLQGFEACVHGMCWPCASAELDRVNAALAASQEEIKRLRAAIDRLCSAAHNITGDPAHLPAALRRHPSPCDGLDFCVVSDLRLAVSAARKALADPTPEGG